MSMYESTTHHIVFEDPYWVEDPSEDHDSSGEVTPRPDSQLHSIREEDIVPTPSPDVKSQDVPKRPPRLESDLENQSLKEVFDFLAQYPRLFAPPNVIPPPPELCVTPIPRCPGSPDLIYEELKELNRLPKCKGIPHQSVGDLNICQCSYYSLTLFLQRPLTLKLDAYNRFKCPACKVVFTIFSDVVIHTVNWGEKSAETVAEFAKLSSVKDGEKRRRLFSSPKISLPDCIARI